MSGHPVVRVDLLPHWEILQNRPCTTTSHDQHTSPHRPGHKRAHTHTSHIHTCYDVHQGKFLGQSFQESNENGPTVIHTYVQSCRNTRYHTVTSLTTVKVQVLMYLPHSIRTYPTATYCTVYHTLHLYSGTPLCELPALQNLPIQDTL